ncbi:MAG: exosortase K [Lachnospiraceae bacterium]|nr:exosortase K [Lachnospiraceae bacterium]
MKKNRTVYLAAVLAVLALKLFYRNADSETLTWILAPTTWWVQILSGIAFERTAQVGYVSHEYRFVIAASCSGVRFLLIAFVMLVFSFTHLISSGKKKVCWLAVSAVFSYIGTVFVNGIRITVSIYLPLILMDSGAVPGWLTGERLHTMIGTTVYFSLLFGIYFVAKWFCFRFFAAEKTVRLWQPAFWYFVMVLGIPSAGRLYRNDWAGFGQYAALVACVGALVFLAVCGGSRALSSAKLRVGTRIGQTACDNQKF